MTGNDQRRDVHRLGVAIIASICLAGGDTARAAGTTEYEYNDAGDVTRTFIHDGQGVTVSDTFTTYDSLGRQSTVYNRATVASNVGATTTTYAYDVAGRLATKAVKIGGQGDFATSYVYDALGRQVTVQGPATSAANAPVTVYDYDLNGNVVTQSVKLYGTTYASTATEYDGLNRATKVTDAGGNYRTTVYDSQGRSITTSAYANGGGTPLEQTQTVYDTAGRAITRVRLSSVANGVQGAATDNVVVYGYDADGHVTTQTTYNMGTQTALNTTSEYDDLGRLTKTTDPNGFWEQTEYDSGGLATKRISYDYSPGQTFAMSYDSDGRMTRQVALGSTNLTTSYQYDCLDRRTRVIDPKGYATAYEYDLLGRQTKVTEDDGGSLPRPTWSMYNQQGWLTDLIAYDGVNYQTTHYGYSDAGLKATIWYPDCTNYADANDAIVFQYDLAGRVTARQDQYLSDVGKRALAYTYDVRGLLVTKSDGGGYQESFVYDGLGRMVTALKGASGAESATTYSYDDLSRVTKESQAIAAGTAMDTISAYDQAGNRITLICPTTGTTDVVTLAYQYDANNRATKVRRKLGARAEQDLMTYDYHGRDMSQRRLRTEYPEVATQIQNPATIYVDYAPEYDDHRRITKISDLVNNSGGGNAKKLAVYDYTLDEAGNRLSHTGHGNVVNGADGFANARTVGYAYDQLHRVTRADYTFPAGVSTVFEYDLLGNRNTVYDTLNNVTYGYAHNEANEYTLVSPHPAPDDAYLYDVYGNLSRDDGFDTVNGDYFEYSYDPENRLTSVGYYPGSGSLTQVAAYRYDARGRRVEFVNSPPVGATTTLRYYYDGPNVIAEYLYDGSSATLTRTYVNGTQYVDERAVMRDHRGNGQDYYYLLEELYSVAGLAKANGALAEASVYDTYGQATLYNWGIGDYDRDGDCDLFDFGHFNGCFNGPNRPPNESQQPGCEDADTDLDGDIDLTDFGTFNACFNGPNRPAIGFAKLTQSAVGNPHLFTGRITEAIGMDGTNYRRLQDNRNRMYDPKHGRWLQRDPLGVRPGVPMGSLDLRQQHADGPNLYAYARGNPPVVVDPRGHSCEETRPQVTKWQEWYASKVYPTSSRGVAITKGGKSTSETASVDYKKHYRTLCKCFNGKACSYAWGDLGVMELKGVYGGSDVCFWGGPSGGYYFTTDNVHIQLPVGTPVITKYSKCPDQVPRIPTMMGPGIPNPLPPLPPWPRIILVGGMGPGQSNGPF